MTRSFRLLGLVLSVAALLAACSLYSASNDISFTGNVMLVIVSLLGTAALAALFLAVDLHLAVRFMGLGLVGGVAALFGAGLFGSLVNPDYIGMSNADKRLAREYFTDRVSLRDCSVSNVDGISTGVTVKTDGYACVVTYDREHNGVTVILHGGINLNNTRIHASDDLRTTTLTFPATGSVDFFLFNKDRAANPLPQWVLNRGGDGHKYEDGSTRYMLARRAA